MGIEYAYQKSQIALEEIARGSGSLAARLTKAKFLLKEGAGIGADLPLHLREPHEHIIASLADLKKRSSRERNGLARQIFMLADILAESCNRPLRVKPQEFEHRLQVG